MSAADIEEQVETSLRPGASLLLVAVCCLRAALLLCLGGFLRSLSELLLCRPPATLSVIPCPPVDLRVG